jgi:hypothetical protein
MSLKLQLGRLKENWLLALIIIALVLAPNFTNLSSTSFSKNAVSQSFDMGMPERSFMASGFAPEVEERVLTKSSSLNSEIKRGQFQEKDSKIKSIIKESEGFILNENNYKNEISKKTYISASYQIKVLTTNYENTITQLKTLGEVKSFNQNIDDITEQKLDLETNLQAERNRLTKYQKIFDESTSATEKLEVTDRIFNQERTIKFYEERLENLNNRVSYSNINLNINEKSEYSSIAFIKLSQIAKNFVDSINAVIKLIVTVIPWAIILSIFYLIYKKIKN